MTTRTESIRRINRTSFGLSMLAWGLFSTSSVLAQTCALPGGDGAATPGGGTGIVNSYWPVANGSFGPATASLSLGTRTGAAVNLQPGDLVLVIQMQCANITTADALTYGDGIAGEPASGHVDPASGCLAGRHEFVRAGAGTNASTLVLAGSPLQNSYQQAAATNSAGRRSMQVVRVPQYQSAILAGGLTAVAWDGSTGGIVAIDVAGTLDLNGRTVNVDGLGFRGGGGRSRSQDDAVQRFVWNDDTRHATKGEGIVGTPRFVSEKRDPGSAARAAVTDLGTGWGGYPTGSASNGDFARGAPGNAGGGGTYWNANSDNGGGGGGGNGGPGGRGGVGWRSAGYGGVAADYSNLTDKKWGFGGGALAAAGVARVVLGGGGGGGDNNGNSGTNGHELSSGAAGGGIIMMRATTITGSGTLSARGARAADNAGNDGAGAGGAGGSVVMVANTWTASPAVDVRGGRGGDSFLAGDSGHAGGGGGGGGVAILSGLAVVDFAGGAPGLTNTAQSQPGGAQHGAEAGGDGARPTVTPASDTPGANAGYKCGAALQVSKDNSQVTYTPGGTGSYTVTLSNAGPGPALNYTISDSLPAGVTLSAPWTCVALPAGVLGSSCSAASGGAANDTSVNLTGTIANGGTLTVTIPVQYSTDPSAY